MNQMRLNFLVDVSAGLSVTIFLRSEGYDAISVQEINPRMKDEEIIRLAVRDKRIIVTMDKDFGELVYRCLMNHSGILLLRLDNEKSSEKQRILKYILQYHKSHLHENFCVFHNDKIRIRPSIANRSQS